MQAAKWIVLIIACAAALPTAARADVVRTRPELITPQAEAAIEKGLAYLARTQGRNGAWRTGSRGGSYPCAMTSLAGISLMAGGNTPNEGPYARNVRKAVHYVLKCSASNANGLIAAANEEQRPMYAHGFGMLFLAQAYGMEQDEDLQRRIYRALRRGVRLTERSQSDDGGWLYTPDANGDEGSVTITQIQALRAARNAGIDVHKSTIDRAVTYVVKCANKDGGISYSLRNRGHSRTPITAAAVATLYNAGKYDSPVMYDALDYIKREIGGNKTTASVRGHSTYMLLYTGMAMYLSSEENWKRFFPRHRDMLVKEQSKEGSWNGDHVGPIYGTTASLIVLQLPYKYLPILQR